MGVQVVSASWESHNAPRAGWKCQVCGGPPVGSPEVSVCRICGKECCMLCSGSVDFVDKDGYKVWRIRCSECKAKKREPFR